MSYSAFSFLRQDRYAYFHDPAPPLTQQYWAGYQQALSDFALTDLLNQLQTFCDPHFDAVQAALATSEAEALAAVLIQTLATNLNGELIATYLEVMRHEPLATFPILANLHPPPSASDLPSDFPNVAIPRFLYGDRLRWTAHDDITDWGIVIGRFYSFAPHRCHWHWCYLIWLDPDSPSSAWVSADITWEDDLEPLETEPMP